MNKQNLSQVFFKGLDDEKKPQEPTSEHEVLLYITISKYDTTYYLCT